MAIFKPTKEREMRVRRSFVFMCMAVIFTVLVWTGFFGVSAIGKESGNQKAVWRWTEQNPKPEWWNLGSREGRPVRGGIYRSASARYVGLMNPNHWPVLDWGAITYIYDGIAYIDASQNPAGLWLAESLEYTDSLTAIMKLRPGITFHDGTPFNAEAVKFTIYYMKDKKNGAWSRSWVEPVKSIEVLDELTLKWNFKKPWAGFMGMMSTVPGYMMSKKALEGDMALKELGKVEKKIKKSRAKVTKLEKAAKGQTGEKAQKTTKKIAKEKKKAADLEKLVAGLRVKAKGAKDLDTNPVGAGSYMLEEGKPGNYLKLKRNPNWWFGQAMGMDMPFFDGRLITVIPDEAVRLANLRGGKIDYMGLSPTQYMDLKDDPNFNITNSPRNAHVSLIFNQAKGPAKDIRVRKAISHAIDRKALVVGLLYGQGIIASSVYHTAHWAHNPNLKPVTYDPELSRKLLKEAGYAKGLTIEGYIGTTSGDVSRAEAIKAMLAKVGVTWKVVSLDAASSSDRGKNLEYDMAAGGWGYLKEPDMVLQGMYHPDGGWHHGRNNIPGLLPLIEKGKAELVMKKRQKIYWEIERVLYENYADIWLYYQMSTAARSKRIMGFEIERSRIGGEYYHFSHRRWFKDGKRTAD
jgi:peptide/nickel transport system substrate-binding protein